MRNAGFCIGVLLVVIGCFQLSSWLGWMVCGILLIIRSVMCQMDIDKIIKEAEEEGGDYNI
jgi:uncharacterized membrane protein YciS (DUF1049 family)